MYTEVSKKKRRTFVVFLVRSLVETNAGKIIVVASVTLVMTVKNSLFLLMFCKRTTH